MKLLTAAIKKALPKLYSTDKVQLEDKKVICKFFDPCGRSTFYVFEGEEEDGDWRFFGFVVSAQGPELDEQGYFVLSELESVRGHLGLSIERDINFQPTTFSNIRR
jgi:hypothetical protein